MEKEQKKNHDELYHICTINYIMLIFCKSHTCQLIQFISIKYNNNRYSNIHERIDISSLIEHVLSVSIESNSFRWDIYISIVNITDR